MTIPTICDLRADHAVTEAAASEPAATEMHSTTVETAVRSTAEPATTEPAVRATANSPLQNRAAGTKSCAATFDYYLAVSATLDTTAPTEDMVIISNEQNGRATR